MDARRDACCDPRRSAFCASPTFRALPAVYLRQPVLICRLRLFTRCHVCHLIPKRIWRYIMPSSPSSIQSSPPFDVHVRFTLTAFCEESSTAALRFLLAVALPRRCQPPPDAFEQNKASVEARMRYGQRFLHHTLKVISWRLKFAVAFTSHLTVTTPSQPTPRPFFFATIRILSLCLASREDFCH